MFFHSEILTGDPQLAEEIQFDLRKFDEEQKRLLTEKPQTPNMDTPLGQMVVTNKIDNFTSTQFMTTHVITGSYALIIKLVIWYKSVLVIIRHYF